MKINDNESAGAYKLNAMRFLILKHTILYFLSALCTIVVFYLLFSELSNHSNSKASTGRLQEQLSVLRTDLQAKLTNLPAAPSPPEIIRQFVSAAEHARLHGDEQFYLVDHRGHIRGSYPEVDGENPANALPYLWALLAKQQATGFSEHVLVSFTIPDSGDITQAWYLVGLSSLHESFSPVQFKEWRWLLLSIVLAATAAIAWLIARQQIHKQTMIRRLSESETMYRLFSDNSHDWEEWVTPAGEHKYISPSCLRITSYSQQEFTQNPRLIEDIIHLEDLAAYKEHIARHQKRPEDQGADSLEFRIHRKSGEIRWIKHSCHPIKDEQGKILGRYIVNRDITEDKKNDQLVRESIELSYATLESSADHIVILDSQGIIQIVNTAWQNFGYENESKREKKEWVGINYLNICSTAKPPSNEGAGEVYHGLRKVIKGQIDRFEFEYPCHSPTEERWFLLRAVPLQSHSGGVLVSHTDITQQKIAERELQLAASSFQASDAILITDAANRIIRVNEAFSRTTGYSEMEVIGKSPAILQSGRHEASFYETMWQSLNDNGFWEGEVWNRRKSGETYPEHLKINVVKNDIGNVMNYIATFTDISQQKNAEEQIHKLAFYDPLTELPNKSLFTERLEQALHHSKQDKKLSAVLLLDLNNFKLINESLGHNVGDHILIEVAKRIARELRQTDSAAHLSGDEFAVLAENIADTPEGAAEVLSSLAERFLSLIKRPYQIENRTINLSACIGIDIFPMEGDTATDVLMRADTAIHRAKETPGQDVVYYREEMQADINRRLNLQTALREAVQNQHFLLYFQDKVDQSEQIIGSEALIRWNHPEQGILPPGHFIDVAENCDLIIDLGNWVLQTACGYIKRLQRAQPGGVRTIAVNISGTQFRQDNFVQTVESIIAESSIDASWLEMEITESIAMHDITEAVDKMNALKAYGIRWSMDDFGTGFSSLSYLKDLPFDSLKIDRSFINNIHVNKKNQAIVKAIISMAHNLQLEVVAEGVERAEEVAFLKSVDCECFQGYFYSKPRPPEID